MSQSGMQSFVARRAPLPQVQDPILAQRAAQKAHLRIDRKGPIRNATVLAHPTPNIPPQPLQKESFPPYHAQNFNTYYQIPTPDTDIRDLGGLPEIDRWEASTIGDDLDTTMTVGDLIATNNSNGYHHGPKEEAGPDDEYVDDEDGQDDVDDENYSQKINLHGGSQEGYENYGPSKARALETLDTFIDNNRIYVPPDQHHSVQTPKPVQKVASPFSFGIAGRFVDVDIPMHLKPTIGESVQGNVGQIQNTHDFVDQQLEFSDTGDAVGTEHVDHATETVHDLEHDAPFQVANLDNDVPGEDRELFASSDPGDITVSVRSNSPSPLPQVDGNRAARKRPVVELDYDEDSLYSMSYEEIKNQPFDYDPRRGADVDSQLSRETKLPLVEQLTQLVGQSHEFQAGLFADMSMEQWEESGDWFLEQFGGIISKLRVARRQKREISKRFEDELAAREEAVRDRSENIKEIMQNMKAGGQGVLNGKTFR